MKVVFVALVMVSAATVLWVGWGRVPEGRMGTWMLSVRARLRPATVDERYRLAERYNQAGDFEKSQRECQRVLQVRPGHALSKELFTEVSFILGQGNVSTGTPGFPVVRYQQPLFEIDHALERAKRHRSMGEREAALREVRKVLEFAKWMPEGVELLDRRNKAKSLEILLTAP
jgi:hypothetical protein